MPESAITLPESVWTTWGVMVLLLVLSILLGRCLRREGLEPLQNAFELFMEQLCSLIREIVHGDPRPYVPFIGTLFVFVFVSNLVGMIPGLSSPTADISVTAGLAFLVFLSVPYYGIRARGVKRYIRSYLQPNPFLLPFNLLGEVTRTLSLAIRLFGNIMSGEFLFLVVVGVITTLLRGYSRVFLPAGYVLTLFLSVLSLITAAIQAYIFTVLALVYVGSAVEQAHADGESDSADRPEQSESVTDA